MKRILCLLFGHDWYFYHREGYDLRCCPRCGKADTLGPGGWGR